MVRENEDGGRWTYRVVQPPASEKSEIPGKVKPVFHGVLIRFEVIGNCEVVHDADFGTAAAAAAGKVVTRADSLVETGAGEFFRRSDVHILVPFVGEFALKEKTLISAETNKCAHIGIEQTYCFEAGLFVRAENKGYPRPDRKRFDDFITDLGGEAKLEYAASVAP